MTARRVWTAPLMGTVFSVRLIGAVDADVADAAAEHFFAEIADLERAFSPFLDDSDISRIRRGELSVRRADPCVGEVEAACAAAERATEGRFSAAWRGGFDPTGYVKGWAVDRAGFHHLEPLLAEPGAVAVGVGAGGDVRVWTAPHADWTWRIGIADPHRPGAVLAAMEIANGAMATSGTAERGRHITDPRTGEPAQAVRSATVVAADLATADVWATAAVVAGDDLSWIGAPGITAGMVVSEEARVRRWSRGVEVTMVESMKVETSMVAAA